MSKKESAWAILQSEKELRYFLYLRFLLTIALQVQAVIVGWELYRITHDPLSLGLVALAEIIPAMSVTLYAGHVADISDKRKILLVSLALMFFCTVGITAGCSQLLGDGHYAVKNIYLFIFLSGFARGFYAPTSFSFLSQLVDTSLLSKASTWSSSSWQIAAIAGPALGGLLYARYGIGLSLAVVLLFELLACYALLRIRSKPVLPYDGKETVLKRLGEGIKFVFKHQVILAALSLDLFAVLFGGAVALLPVFADEILKVGPEGLGMLRAAPSLGASITMLFFSVRPPFEKPGPVLLYCVAAFGLCMIAFGFSEHFYLSAFFLFLSGAFDSVSVIIRSNILQLQTPDHMRGRVSAVNSIFIGSSNEIGAFESGLAARLMGTVPSVVFGGSMTLLVVAFTGWKSKALRNFRYGS